MFPNCTRELYDKYLLSGMNPCKYYPQSAYLPSCQGSFDLPNCQGSFDLSNCQGSFYLSNCQGHFDLPNYQSPLGISISQRRFLSSPQGFQNYLNDSCNQIGVASPSKVSKEVKLDFIKAPSNQGGYPPTPRMVPFELDDYKGISSTLQVESQSSFGTFGGQDGVTSPLEGVRLNVRNAPSDQEGYPSTSQVEFEVVNKKISRKSDVQVIPSKNQDKQNSVKISKIVNKKIYENVQINIKLVTFSSSSSTAIVDNTIYEVPYDNDYPRDKSIKKSLLGIHFKEVKKVFPKIGTLIVDYVNEETNEERPCYGKKELKGERCLFRFDTKMNQQYKLRFSFHDKEGEKLKFYVKLICLKTEKRRNGKDFKNFQKRKLIDGFIEKEKGFKSKFQKFTNVIGITILIKELKRIIKKRVVKVSDQEKKGLLNDIEKIKKEFLKEKKFQKEPYENFKSIIYNHIKDNTDKKDKKKNKLLILCFEKLYDSIFDIKNACDDDINCVFNIKNADKSIIGYFYRVHPEFVKTYNFGHCRKNDIVIFNKEMEEQLQKDPQRVRDTDNENKYGQYEITDPEKACSSSKNHKRPNDEIDNIERSGNKRKKSDIRKNIQPTNKNSDFEVLLVNQ